MNRFVIILTSPQPLSFNPLYSPLSGGNYLPPLIRGGLEGLKRGEEVR